MPKPFDQLTPDEIQASAEDLDPTALRAYSAYAASSGGVNFQGKPMPTWLELPAAIRGHWRAAVEAVIESL